MALTGLLLPGMVSRRRGGVINVASTAGFQPTPTMATYGASKAFVVSSSSLVVTMCRMNELHPGVFATPRLTAVHCCK